VNGTGGIGSIKGRGLGKQADVALGALLLGIVALMIVPIPTPLLDVLLATNLALSTVLLLVSMSLRDGLSFAAMPTVLLVTTLFRLALNVSSTRLILLQADAGRVIESFGQFVVRGNYAVGAVVFLVLTLIQYVVVARGAERVAEVGARFTLDAMPGRQLAIDSDLRSGAIDVGEARDRRKALDRESQLYGAMDGAMKFVKGDAIAGIVITLVNVIAGVAIGVTMRGLTATQSLRVYGLLTIGDGLVCQIPSLLVATSAGLVVTRVASADGGSLGLDVARQMFGSRRVLAMAGAFLGLLALVPGLPAFPFATLALLLGAASWGVGRATSGAQTDRAGEDAARAMPPFAPLGIALGPTLAARVLATARPLEHALEAASDRLGARLGVRLPRVALRLDPALSPHAYTLLVSEVPLERGELTADLAPELACERLSERLATLALRHPSEILGLSQTQRLLDELGREQLALLRAVMPKPVSLALLCEVLRRLLAEGVTVRPLAHILETLGAEAPRGLSAAKLTERVRVRLARHLTHALAPNGVLHAHRLDPMIEDALRDAVRAGSDDEPALPPEQARDVVAAVRRTLGTGGGDGAIVLCQADVRRALRALIEDELPDVPVLAYEELTSDVTVERAAAVKLPVELPVERA